MRGPSFTGLGNRPSLIPAHHVDLLTGMGPFGAMIAGNRTKPVVGKSVLFGMVPPRLFNIEVVLDWPIATLAEFGWPIT